CFATIKRFRNKISNRSFCKIKKKIHIGICPDFATAKFYKKVLIEEDLIMLLIWFIYGKFKRSGIWSYNIQ
ncbi:MAG: hypothetical protein KKF56_00985, partial [Nanoarchaeota archaeon]|nr:hypothetical protein [Nanoarchaeota archaeon]